MIPRHRVTTDLAAHLATVTGWPVGIGQAPGPDNQLPPAPYLVVHRRDTGPAAPDFTRGHGHIQLRYQITVVADRHDQADLVVSDVIDALLAGWTETGGYTLMEVRHLGDIGYVDEPGGQINAGVVVAVVVAPA